MSGPEYRVIPATQAHAIAMCGRMRAADVAEVRASIGVGPDEALRRSLAFSSHAWAGLVDGEVACLFGVGMTSLIGGVGAPWLLGTDLIARHGTAFLRRNRPHVAFMLSLYPKLENWVDARNGLAIEWLRWLGFSIMPAEPYGPFGLPFHRFEMQIHRHGRDLTARRRRNLRGVP